MCSHHRRVMLKMLAALLPLCSSNLKDAGKYRWLRQVLGICIVTTKETLECSICWVLGEFGLVA